MQVTHEMLMAGRSGFDEHEEYVASRAAMEIAEKLGIALDDSFTPQEMVLRVLERQQGDLRGLTYADEAVKQQRLTELQGCIDEQALVKQREGLDEEKRRALKEEDFEKCIQLKQSIHDLKVLVALCPHSGVH